MYEGDNGWAIASAETYDDVDRRDEVEAESLFDLLERQIVPMFYDRFEGPVPRRWVRRVKSSLRTLGPRVVATRMVRDYVDTMYEPIASRADAMTGSGYARARALAEWKHRVAAAWPDVHVDLVESDSALADLGAKRDVDAVIALGALTGDDAAGQPAPGPVRPSDQRIA